MADDQDEPAQPYRAPPSEAMVLGSVGGLLLMVLGFGLLFSPVGCATSCGQGHLVLGAVQDCARARELLGEGIHAPVLGVASGNIVYGGDGDSDDTPPGYDGWAFYTFDLVGSRGRGRYHYVALKKDGQWTLRDADLTVGAERLDIKACPAP